MRHRTLPLLSCLPVILLVAGLLAGLVVPADAAGDPGRSAAVRPVVGAVVRPFDPPAHPYGPGHRGVDLAAEPGDVVRAALGGRVTFAGTVAGVAWVTVDHGGGLNTTYGDVSATLAAGSPVLSGDPLGRLAPEAAHLDWGARLDGGYIDPMSLLVRWRLHLADPAALVVVGSPTS